jgi:hypothetical protein
MTKKKRQDPELLDDPDEGAGDNGVYGGFTLPPYDHSQFELPDDFEYKEGDDEDG